MTTICNIPNSRTLPREKILKMAIVIALLFCAVWPIYLSSAPAAISSPQVSLPKMPLAFVPNLGQTNPDVRFQAHDLDGTLFMTADGLEMLLQNTASGQPANIKVTYQNSSSTKEITGLDPLQGTVNYINRSNPEKWRLGLPTFSSVLYKGLYPGIDLYYTGNAGAVENVYQVSPGSNPALIRWNHAGIQNASVSKTGDLQLYLANQTKPILSEKAPLAWQDINGTRIYVPAQFKIFADHSVGFDLGSYDQAYGLTIDPTLILSTYLGGSMLDDAEGIALDSSRNIYITGTTSSNNFPTEAPLQSAKKGSDDIYVIKLNPAGDTLIYSTYLGGSQDDEGSAITVDAEGNAYIAGQTFSKDFPTKNAYADKCKMDGDQICVGDALLAKLSADGSTLLYSTYLGGYDPDYALGVAVNSIGQAYLTGATFSTNFPTKSPYQTALKGYSDAFLTAIDTTKAGAESLLFSTYLGGKSDDFGTGIVLAGGTKPVITGFTVSSDFPTQSPLQAALKGQSDVFITEFNAAGSALDYSTYLGGSLQDYAYGIAADAQGNVFVTGNTVSTDFPTVGALQSTLGGKSDAFVTGIKNDGSAWLLSSYLGGTEDDFGYGVAVDQAGKIYLTGKTGSADFPTQNAFQPYGGYGDAFVTKLAVGQAQPVYSTFLGGKDSDYGASIAVDNLGNSLISGITFSADFPLKNPIQTTYSGGGDVFLAIVADSGENPPIPTPPTPSPTPPPPVLNPLYGSYKIASQTTLDVGETVTYTIHLHNSGTANVTASVVDQLPAQIEYATGSASNGGIYDQSKRTITWTDVVVPAGQEIPLTLDVTTNETVPSVAVNKATITAGEDTIIREYPIMVGVKKPTQNVVRPVVEKFTIDDKDVLTSPDVTLHIQLAADSTADWMYLREWQISQTPMPHWQVVKSSGWIPFDANPAWKLGEQSGVHFMAVAVADANRNVSMLDKNSLDFASLLPDSTTVVQGGLVPYLVYFPKGANVDIVLTPASGDADLFVWYPDNFLMPDKYSMKTGNVVDEVTFTAPRSGVYVIMVFGREDTVYNLAITPAGGLPVADSKVTTVPAIAAGQSMESASGITYEPMFSVIGLDPLASGTAKINDKWLFLPSISR